MTRPVAAVLGLATLVALAPAAPVPTHLFPKDPPLYYPTQKGTRWVYENGMVEHTYELTEAVADERTGAKVITVSEVDGEERTPYRTFEVSHNGIRGLGQFGDAFDKPFWVLRYPVRDGDAWPYTASGKSTANTEGTMKVAGGEEIEVPAGKFKAVRMEDDSALRFAHGLGSDRFRSTLWFAAGVGLVRAKYPESTKSLKSFTPGKE